MPTAGETPQDRPLGIVHRDVSPQNVLISEHGEVKVTDFGIAKALGKRERTQTGIIKGKLDFMSPEQASGAELNASSDIFAAGTMLYFLATGRRPFASPSDFEALLRVQRADFVAADQARPGLSPAVARVIAKAMKMDPADRYLSAEEMMLDLEAVMRQEFGSPGQSQLARWLTELSQRDGAQPVSKRPGMSRPQSLTSRWFAEGEMLSFDDSSNVSNQLGGSLALSAGSLALSAAAPPPSAPSLTHGGPEPFRPAPAYAPPVTAGSSLPSALGPGPTRPRSRYRMMLVPPPRRRGLLRALVVLLLLVAAGAVAVDRFLSKEQQRELQKQAKQLVKKGVDGVASVIESSQAQPDPVKAQNEKQSGMTPDPGARATLPDEARLEKEVARAGRRRRGQEVTITLLSRPAGAEVSGPRGPLGVTPVDLTAKVGSTQSLTFSKPGFAPTVKKITVDRNETTVTVELKAVGP